MLNLPRLPVPEVHGPVVGPGDEDAVVVERHAVDDGVVPAQVLDEPPLGALPLLDVVRGGGGEHVERGVGHHGADALLVVGQGGQGLAGGQVPQADGLERREKY